MTELSVMAAFKDRLIAEAPSGLQVFFPGFQKTPPQQGGWLEAKLFPAPPVARTWANTNQISGFFQVLVCWRNGVGVEPAYQAAQVVGGIFPYGLRLGPVKVSSRPNIGPAVPEDSFFFVTVTIPYLGSDSEQQP